MYTGGMIKREKLAVEEEKLAVEEEKPAVEEEKLVVIRKFNLPLTTP